MNKKWKIRDFKHAVHMAELEVKITERLCNEAMDAFRKAKRRIVYHKKRLEAAKEDNESRPHKAFPVAENLSVSRWGQAGPDCPIVSGGARRIA